jgi:hypothetical protein
VAPRQSNVREFLAKSGEAVLSLTGGERLHLTEFEFLPDDADEEGGHDFISGIVSLHPTKVLAWIERILNRSIEGPDQGQAALNALVTVIHELVHCVGPADRGDLGGRSLYYVYGLKGPVDYEEAISELAARMLLTPYMELLDVHHGLPSSATFESAIYWAKMAAVAPVIETFATEAHIGMFDAVRTLAAHVPDSRGRAVATVLADRRGHDESPRRANFIQLVERAFMDLQQVPDITADGYAGWARQQLEAAIIRSES